ncbi:MAG: InlB B-repeat-containing protein [Clostridia bacterium]|nr:InlB B-repeat-containing protein [Clostridia bacterium]
MLKKTRSSLVALLLSVMMVLSVASFNINAKADTTATDAFTGGIAQTGNLFEIATVSDANYIINKWDGNGDSLVTVGDYIATAANGSHVTVGGISQMPITTTDASKALSYSGAKLTLEETTTLEMGVVDLTDSRAEDVSPVIGFVPSLNFLGPKTADEVTNPYLGIYYTFRSTVNPEKYFSIAMKESKTYKYASLGVGYNGAWTHYGQGLPNDPGAYWNIDDSDRIGYYSFRFDGSMITNTSGQCSGATKRVWIADNVAADGGEAEYNYNYPVKIYYDYETSCFYQQAVEYTRRDKFGDKGMRVTAEDGSHRYLLFNAAEGSMGKGYSTANKNSNGWEGFTEEEAKSVAVSMHVDWNPEYTGSHDILITDFAGEKVSTANADTLKANKGSAGLLREFTSQDGTLTLGDNYNVMLSDNDIFTKLVSFEVYPEQMGKSKTVNKSGLYSVSFQLSDGTDTLNLNLTNFEELGAEETIVDYRNCYTVSVNGEERWAQNQTMAFTTGDFGFPSPYGFDKYVRYPASILLDQYGVDNDPGVDETVQWYSSDVIRTDTDYTPMASYSIYYNAADNCLYVDVGSWVAERYTNHERADGVTVKRWKIADLGSTYNGQREAFEGFGDNLLSFSMSTTLMDGFDSVKIRVLEVDGQKLGTDKDGKVAISTGESAKAFAPVDDVILAGKNVSVPSPYRHNVLVGKVDLGAEDFTAKITTPDGQICDAVDGKFDFVQIGEYKVEYFVDGASIGETILTPAAMVDGELVALTSFTVKEGLSKGDVLTFADLSVTASDTLSLEGATIVLSKGGEVVLTSENVDSSWTTDALVNGTYEITITTDEFTVTKAFEVKTSIKPSAPVENGSVKVSGMDGEAILLEGSNTIQIIANEGYVLDTFTIGGEDVTAEVVNGYYTYDAQDVSEHVYYTVTFKKLTYTITFMAAETVIGTVEGVEAGTLFKDIDAPDIPAKEGYISQGWSIDGDSAITGDVTAYAVYGLKPYVITFDTAGGTPIDAKEYTEGEVVTAFTETTTKEGYDFDGWYLGEEKFVFGNALTEDITLTAKWIAKKFTVTIVNGLFADTTIEVEYDKAVDTSSISKDGYTFGGLFTDKECTKKYNGEKITGATTLYASWTKIEEKKGGCMGSVSATSIFAGLAILMAGTIIRRKNDNK